MKVRETILYIGSNENDRGLFRKAILTSGVDCNFLALDNETYTITLLKRSQPFWFHSIFYDLSDLTLWNMSFIKEIRTIAHLKHVPLVVAAQPYILNGYELGFDTGVKTILFKPLDDLKLAEVFINLQSGLNKMPFNAEGRDNHVTNRRRIAS